MNKWITRAGACLVLGLATQAPASAQTLFYNGQFNGVDGQTSASHTGNADAIIFDNFVVGGSGWQVSGVFGEYLSNTSWTTANWEIRTGITPGNGGTLVASGLGAASKVATGRSAFGYTEYRATVNGLNLLLTPGTYWLGLAPVGIDNTPAHDIYLSYTSGLNGVAKVIDGDYFVRSNAVNYQELAHFNNPDFALGVLGTAVATSTVPEPSAILLMASGLFVIAFARRKHLTRRC